LPTWVEILDNLVLIMKNWLDDPNFGCTNGLKSIEYLDVKNNMISKSEDFICQKKSWVLQPIFM
jgi:hypothetical protein